MELEGTRREEISYNLVHSNHSVQERAKVTLTPFQGFPYVTLNSYRVFTRSMRPWITHPKDAGPDRQPEERNK